MPSRISHLEVLPKQEKYAREYLSQIKFHRRLVIPATESRARLTVTYSIAGIEEGPDVPTIFFCGGMFGSRLQAVYMDWIALKEGVRVIFMDRPGFGDSIPVSLQDRISTFLEVAPLLLSHLKIPHIVLAGHSAGTIYALNFLSAYPDLLYPKYPSVTLFGPYVHPSRSSVSFLHMASLLPDPLIDHWNGLTNFLINTVNPKLDSSGGVITGFSSMFRFPSAKEKTKQAQKEEEEKCIQGYGVSRDVKKEYDRLVFKYGFAEQTVGANDEARLCLKCLGSSWGAWENCEAFVEKTKRVWEERSRGPDGQIIEEKRLSIAVNFAEEDIMIGTKGKKYFEQCWAQDNCGEGIVVSMEEFKGTNHDSVGDASNAAIPALLQRAKSSWAKWKESES